MKFTLTIESNGSLVEVDETSGDVIAVDTAALALLIAKATGPIQFAASTGDHGAVIDANGTKVGGWTLELEA